MKRTFQPFFRKEELGSKVLIYYKKAKKNTEALV